MKAILAKIVNELLASGVPREAAVRIAYSVVIDELTKTGVELSKAYNMVFGEGSYETLAEEIYNAHAA